MTMLKQGGRGGGGKNFGKLADVILEHTLSGDC